VTLVEMSVFHRPAENSRQHLIGKKLFIAAIILAIPMLGFFAIGFGRFGTACLYGIFLMGGVYEMIRGLRLLLRVLTHWVPGLMLVSERYEGWLDADPSV